MIYALQYLKSSLYSKNTIHVTTAFLSLVGSIIFAYIFHSYFSVDYGFAGNLVPFTASICMSHKKAQKETERTRGHLLSVLFCGISLIILAYPFRGVQIYGLLSLPLLLAYSGERGKANLKNFFYVFYPAHLVILYGIKELLNLLN